MVLAAGVLAVLAVVGSSVSWTRDYTRAFASAEEQRRPLLLFFRENCGGGNRPQNPVTAEGPIEHQEGLSSCDLMQQDVWENDGVIAATGRFSPASTTPAQPRASSCRSTRPTRARPAATPSCWAW